MRKNCQKNEMREEIYIHTCRKSKVEKQIGRMGRSKVDLVDDEFLAEEVRKYKCLYDKSYAAYKDKFKTRNAWREVEKALGCEEGICYYT